MINVANVTDTGFMGLTADKKTLNKIYDTL